VVHFRRDHSLRVPRPDLSAVLGTPNACTQSGCHDDKPLAWSVNAYNKWYGEKRKPHWGSVIAAARAHKPEARAELLQLASDPLRPAVVRATALDLLWAYPGGDTDAVYQKALMDGDALIRRTAVTHTELRDPKAFVKRLAPMLKDPVLAVRIEAASRLSEVSPGTLTETQAKDLKAATEELQQSLAFAADMPSGRYNLGIQAQNRGELAEAEKQYRKALEFDDQFYLARVNLALLLNQQGRNAEAEALLIEALKTHPRDSAIAFNLGLLLAEEGKDREAVAALRSALDADPSLAPAAYNLAVLVGKEKPAEALELSRRAATLEPAEPKYAFTYAYYQAQARDLAGAERTMEALLKVHPGFGEGYLFLAQLYASQGKVEPARELLRGALSAPELSADDKKRIETALGPTTP
jgi:tetratricopeptide (TPR) repeat protein